MSFNRRPFVRAWRCLLLLCGWTVAALAHDTITVDPNAPSPYSLNGAWGQSSATVLHGFATAALKADGLEIELTMADGAAYKLLDPGQNTAGTANATSDVDDAEFQKDKALLNARARTFFKVTSNGANLEASSVSVELTSARDTVFRLLFAAPAPGPLHLEMTYLKQIPAGQKDLLTVLDRRGTTLASASLGADNPALDTIVPGEPVHSSQFPIFIAGLVTAAIVLILLGKLRHPNSPA
jgi:hypothetical protein